MIFTETELKGAFIIDIEKREDLRGFFSRSFCVDEFKEHGLTATIMQGNLSFSKAKHTLRGMHYQINGAEEAKIVRCTRGSLLDVIIDLRKDSPTYLKHIKVKLTADNYRMLYVPEGFAHGFLTLEDNVEANYLVTQFYTPGKERGIRWNDPIFNIDWQVTSPILSEKDANQPDFDPLNNQ